jgi:hypothetical protein
MCNVVQRQADVYVFALLAHREKTTIDPMNVAQWEFYVLPTRVLDSRARSQHSITLRSLQSLTAVVKWQELPGIVETAYTEHKSVSAGSASPVPSENLKS